MMSAPRKQPPMSAADARHRPERPVSAGDTGPFDPDILKAIKKVFWLFGKDKCFSGLQSNEGMVKYRHGDYQQIFIMKENGTMKRKRIMKSAALLLAVLLCGCGLQKTADESGEFGNDGQNSTETGTEGASGEETLNEELPGNGELITAALAGEIPEDSDNEALLRLNLEKNGWQADVEYAGYEAAIQELILKNQISMGPSLLFVEPVDTSLLISDLEDAASSGIVRVSFRELAEDTEAVDYYLGFDEEEAGRKQGEIITAHLPSEDGLTIDFITAKDSYVNRTRWTGLMSALKEKLSEKQLTYYSGSGEYGNYMISGSTEDEIKAAVQEKVSSLYAGHQPDIICCTDDTLAKALVEAYQAENISEASYPLIIGCGGSEWMLKAADNRKIFTVKEDEAALSAAAVSLAQQIIGNQEMEGLRDIDNGMKRVPSLLVAPEN